MPRARALIADFVNAEQFHAGTIAGALVEVASVLLSEGGMEPEQIAELYELVAASIRANGISIEPDHRH